MALSFPTSPVNGQTYVAPNGVTYTYNSSTGTWTAASSSVSIPAAATAAQAAAGTATNVWLPPAFGTPKDAAGMTGATLLPGGNDAARPGTPTTGMLRYTNQASPTSLEFYNGTAWTGLSSAGSGVVKLATVNTTSGTTADFVSLMDWAKYSSFLFTGINLTVNGLSDNLGVSGSTNNGGTWASIVGPAISSLGVAGNGNFGGSPATTSSQNWIGLIPTTGDSYGGFSFTMNVARNMAFIETATKQLPEGYSVTTKLINYTNANIPNAIRFVLNTGPFFSGSISLYGYPL